MDWNIVKDQYAIHKSECFKAIGDYKKNQNPSALSILKNEAHNDELWGGSYKTIGQSGHDIG